MFFLRSTGMNIPVPPLIVRNALPTAALLTGEKGLIDRDRTRSPVGRGPKFAALRRGDNSDLEARDDSHEGLRDLG